MSKLTSNNWIKAITINIVILAAILLCSKLVYETNDDYAIAMRIVDGYPYITFINYYLMELLIGIQGLLHGINAFAVFQIGVAFACFTLITWILLDSGKRGWFMVLAVVIISVFAADHYCMLQFTKLSALMLVTGTLILIDSFINKRNVLFYMAAFVLIYAGFCLRFMNLLVAIGFAGVFLIFWAAGKGRNLKDEGYLDARMIAIFLISLLLLGGTAGLYKASMNMNSSTEELASYVEFDYYRQYVTDYPVYESYEANKAAFDEIGLDENDLYLMDNWYLDYDGAASTENLKAIYEKVYKGSDMSSHSLAKAAAAFAKSLINDITDMNRTGMHIMILLILSLLCLVVYKPRKWLFIIATGCLTMLMYLYIYYLGRPAYRASYIADLAATIWILYYMNGDFIRDSIKGRQWVVKGSSIGAIIIAAVMLLCQIPVYSGAAAMDAEADKSRMSEAVSTELENHPENFYVFGRGQRGTSLYYGDPIHVPEQGYQDNAVGFGSWGTKSPYITDKLKKHDMSNTFSDLINNEKAIVIEGKNLNRLVQYLNKWYGDKESMIVAEPAGEIDNRTLWNIKKY